MAAALTALAALAAGTTAAAPAGQAQEVGAEQVVNGDFANGSAPWFSFPDPGTVTDGAFCAEVPGGLANPWDAIVGQNDIPLTAGGTYSYSFEASGSPGGQVRGVVGLSVAPFDTYFALSSPLTPSTVELGQGFTASTTTSATART